jgi:hypothetical protein
MGYIETTEPGLAAECENVYTRETQREKEMEKARQAAAAEGRIVAPVPSNVLQDSGTTAEQTSSGPIMLGQPIMNGQPIQQLVHPLTPLAHRNLVP